MATRAAPVRARMMSAVAVGVILGLVQSVTAHASVTVTPSSDLVDGQIVDVNSTVTGSLVDAVLQCTGAGSAECDPDTMEFEFFAKVESMAVRRFIQVDEGLVDCAVTTCSAVYETYRVGGGLPVGQAVLTSRNSTPLDFVETRTIELRADSHVVAGATDIAASGLAAPAGAGAFAMLCAGVGGMIVCGSVGSIDHEFDGVFSGQIDARVPILAGDVTVDCRVTPCAAVVVSVSAAGDSFVLNDTISTRLL